MYIAARHRPSLTEARNSFCGLRARRTARGALLSNIGDLISDSKNYASLFAIPNAL